MDATLAGTKRVLTINVSLFRSDAPLDAALVGMEPCAIGSVPNNANHFLVIHIGDVQIAQWDTSDQIVINVPRIHSEKTVVRHVKIVLTVIM